MSTIRTGKLGLGVTGAAACVALIAGCASGSSSAKPAAGGSQTTQAAAAASGSAGSLKTMSTSIGTVLVDASGRTVYELVGDSAAKQTCTQGCLAIWPPVTVNGTQLVVNGHPLFTFAQDSAAGQTKGQNVTDQWGLWLALDASGNPISASAAPSSTAATTKAPAGGGAAF
jgi:predicted lipoprotein with Yx(FWY)xxD motif